MKIKVYVVDFEIPRGVKRRALQIGAPAVLLLGAIAVGFAAVPHTFMDGQTLTAAHLNENFANLDGRVVPTGMIAMFAVGPCPTGWTACGGGGSGSCPNMDDSYIKAGPAHIPRTGSNTHNHGLTDLFTVAAGEHTHTTSSVSMFSQPAHYHMAHINWPSGNTSLYGRFVTGSSSGPAPDWTSTWRLGSGLAAAPDTSLTTNGGVSTTADGAFSHNHAVTMNAVPSHAHALSGLVSNAGHEPVHTTLVFCMKN